jgi:lysophospholipid acyltransferase (LPLAT)-like uncharacterized protein
MRIRSRWLSFFAAGLITAVCRTLVATCRKIHVAEDPRARHDALCLPDDERFILCVWHDALLIPTFATPRRNRRQTCCLVSQHQDGGYLADAMAMLGYSTVRGSTTRGGARAVRQLLSDTAGKHIVITPDGPRGPRRVVKPGAVYLASQTGRRLVVGAYVARTGWRPRGSWTDLLVPRPFTTVWLFTTAPLTIPPDLDREGLEHQLARVQAAMDDLQQRAEACVAESTSTRRPTLSPGFRVDTEPASTSVARPWVAQSPRSRSDSQEEVAESMS